MTKNNDQNNTNICSHNQNIFSHGKIHTQALNYYVHHILCSLHFLLHLNIHLRILIYYFYHILLLFQTIFSLLNILHQILMSYCNNDNHLYILYLFHFFLHLNILLQILIYYYNHILYLYHFSFRLNIHLKY